MKLLLISAVESGSTESGANRLRKLAKGLTLNQVDVSWIYPGSKKKKQEFWSELDCELPQGKFGKVLKIFQLVKSARVWAQQNEGKLIISMPPTWLVVVAWCLSRRLGERVWLDYRDPILNQNINPRSIFFVGIVRFFERAILRRSGGVLLAAPRIADYLHPTPKQRICVYGGIDPDEMVVPAEVNNKSTKIIYGGTFYSGRSPIELVKALAILDRKNHLDFSLDIYAKFNNASEGSELAHLIKSLGLENKIHLFPLVSRQEFLQLSQAADYMLIITHNEGSDYAIPGKVYDYLTMNKKILALSEDLALKEFSEAFHLPIYFAPVKDSERMATALAPFFTCNNVKVDTHIDLSPIFLREQAKNLAKIL